MSKSKLRQLYTASNNLDHFARATLEAAHEVNNSAYIRRATELAKQAEELHYMVREAERRAKRRNAS